MSDIVKPEGDPKTAEIAIVGEAPSTRELQMGRPFVGPAGWVLDECLQSVGIPRKACYITNVFPFQVKKPYTGTALSSPEGELLYKPKGGFSELGRTYVTKLGQELQQCKANIIIALGGTAMDALTGKSAVMNYRGSVLKSTLIGNTKVMCAIHPAAILRGQFTNKYLLRWDLKKAWDQRDTRDIIDPGYEFILKPTYLQSLEYLEMLIEERLPFACDIEVAQRQVSRMTFNWSDTEGISIPYGDSNWSFQEEATLWMKTCDLLQTEGIPKVFHNASFDVQFLFGIHRIKVAGPIEDTMIAQHIMYPDFPKSLHFLASLYTDQPYWKDMVKHGDIEKSDG